jgi:hypothetical protein
MGTRLLDAVTHSGPGYELDHDNSWTGTRVGADRILDSLTHSGPGYSLPGTAEMLEIAALKRQKKRDLSDALLEGIEKYLYAQGQLEAAPKAKDADEKKKHQEAAMECLRAFLQHVDGPVKLALIAAQESQGPLDLRSKFILRKLEHLLGRLESAVNALLQALARSGQPKERITHQSQVAVKRATRSLEVLCHAEAR